MAKIPSSYRDTCNKAVSLRECLNDSMQLGKLGFERQRVGSRKVVKVNERARERFIGGELSGETGERHRIENVYDDESTVGRFCSASPARLSGSYIQTTICIARMYGSGCKFNGRGKRER